MLSSTAVHLQHPVIQIIGQIMNIEHPYLCTGQTQFENHAAMTQKDALNWFECRVFSCYIRLQSLYGSITYINPKSLLEDATQINTLYRV